jgi:hypothetical protein
MKRKEWKHAEKADALTVLQAEESRGYAGTVLRPFVRNFEAAKRCSAAFVRAKKARNRVLGARQIETDIIPQQDW